MKRCRAAGCRRAGLSRGGRGDVRAVGSSMGAVGRAFEWSARRNGVLYVLANGEEANPSARRAQAGMGGDAGLQDRVAATDQRGTLAAAMSGFVEGVEAAADYEELIARSDAVQSKLAAVTGLA